MKTFFALPDNTLNNKLTQILSKKQFLESKNILSQKSFLDSKNEISKDFTILSNDLLNYYATIFFKGNFTQAKQALDETHTDLRARDIAGIFGFGGIIITMIMFCGFLCMPSGGGPEANFELSSSITVFFFTFVIVWILFCCATSIQIWKRHGINYEFLFEIDPNYRMFHMQFYKVAIFFLFVWMFCLMWQVVKMKIPTQFFNDYATFSLCCILFFTALCI